MKKRRNHEAGFKARAALEAVKARALCQNRPPNSAVHQTMIQQWKKALLDGAADIFERGGTEAPEVHEETVRPLHAMIGELAVANEPKVRVATFCHESSSPGPASEA